MMVMHTFPLITNCHAFVGKCLKAFEKVLECPNQNMIQAIQYFSGLE